MFFCQVIPEQERLLLHFYELGTAGARFIG